MDILAIFLALLKLIGIIIILILIIIISMIFCNIKIKTILKYGIDSKINIYTKIIYLFGIIAYVFDNQTGINSVYIFGINLNKNRENKKNKKNKKSLKLKRYEPYNEQNDIVKDKNLEEKSEKINQNQEKNIKNINIEDKKIYKNEAEQYIDNGKKDKKDKKDKKNENKKKKTNSIINIINGIIREKKVLMLTINLAKDLIKCIKIQKNKIKLEYGLDNPSTVGIIYAIINNIVPYLHNNKEIYIIPDFDKEVLIIDMEIIAKTTIFKILIPIIRYILKEPIKKYIKKIKNK